ncbi:MAG: hypothetical protein ACOC2Y_07595 [Spirochaetota bacterium]
MSDNTISRGAAVVLALLVLVALSGCEEGPGVSSEEAEEAFMVAFGGVYIGSMVAQFGQPLPGVELNPESNAVEFTDFDVTDLQTDYETLSGTLTTTGESASADLTLTSGPVESISFTLTAAQLSAEDGLRTTVTVNGSEMEVQLEPEGSVLE